MAESQAAPMGLIDMGAIDTTPGARCALAPAAGASLSASEYQDLMRSLWRTDPGARQHMAVFARRLKTGRGPHVPITGPHAAEARAILTAIGDS